MKNKKLSVGIAIIITAGILIYLIMPLTPKQGAYTNIKGEIFHTIYNIKYSSEANYNKEIDSVFKVFSASLNPFEKGSLINRINENKTDTTDYMIRHIWTTAYRISQITNGKYDVTCSPMINAWGFGFGKNISQNITSSTIDSLKNIVGYKKIDIVGNNIIKADPRMMIDFSSISKGYVCDLVGQMLLNQGCNNYMVDIGGEISYRGVNHKGQPWRIGVERPLDDSTGMIQELQLIVNLQGNGGLATSGNYRNFHIINGKKYAHTIDPISGYPIQTDILSATIVAPSCMLADALATACMVVGSEGVGNLMQYYPEAAYMLILADGKGFKTIMSPAFKNLLDKKYSNR